MGGGEGREHFPLLLPAAVVVVQSCVDPININHAARVNAQTICLIHGAPKPPPLKTHIHRIAGQTGTTQGPNARSLISWIVKQNRACPTPIGAFLQYRGQGRQILVPVQRLQSASGSVAPPEACRKEKCMYPLPGERQPLFPALLERQRGLWNDQHFSGIVTQSRGEGREWSGRLEESEKQTCLSTHTHTHTDTHATHVGCSTSDSLSIHCRHRFLWTERRMYLGGDTANPCTLFCSIATR